MMYLLLLSLLVGSVDARVARGVLQNVENNFVVLANFCYDYLDSRPSGEPTGSLTVTLTPPNPSSQAPAGLVLVPYDDRASSWGAVYDNSRGRFIPGLDCRARVAISEPANGLHRTFPVSSDWSVPPVAFGQGNVRFWYWALACCDCDANVLEGLTYDVALRNDVTGWPERQWEFGWDERGMQDIFLLYFFAYSVLLGLHYLALRKFTALNGSVHKLMLGFSGVLGLEFIAILFNMGHWFSYGGNGIGSPGAQGFATFLNILSRIGFSGILILLAQGYQITTKFIPVREKSSLFGVFGLLAFMYVVQIFWEFLGREPEQVRPPTGERWLVGVLSMVWIAFTVYFARLCSVTISSDLTSGDKRQFATRLSYFAVWMGSLPILNFIYMGIAATHYVRGTVTTNLTFTTFAYLYFTYLTWPNASTAATLNAPEAQVYAQLPGSATDNLL